MLVTTAIPTAKVRRRRDGHVMVINRVDFNSEYYEAVESVRNEQKPGALQAEAVIKNRRKVAAG